MCQTCIIKYIYIYNFVFDWSIQEQLVMINLLQKKDESEKSVYHCEICHKINMIMVNTAAHER
jgi:hypothetical protein